MKTKWDTIIEWMEENNEDVISTFKNGATTEDIAALENLIGKPLPESFKEFYAIHNGQDTGSVFNSAIIEPDSEGLMDIERITAEWKMFESVEKEYYTEVAAEDVEEGVKPLFWNKLWVPIISDGIGNNYCLDLDPDTNGQVGQIIFRDHEGPVYHIVASSFEEWVDDYINAYLD